MPGKVLVGVFCYNEGMNVLNIVKSLIEQLESTDFVINILDDSDESESIEISHSLACLDPRVLVSHSDVRLGRISRANELAEKFLASDFDYLLHFNADLVLGPSCVPSLIRGLTRGLDLVTGVSLSLPGRNLFERSLRVLARPGEMGRLSGASRAPLTGHLAGYSRPGVQALFPLPTDGAAEDLYTLSKAISLHLRISVVSEAIVYYRLCGSLSEYLVWGKRVFGMTRLAVLQNEETGVKSRNMLYDDVKLKMVVSAIFSDPVASLVLPFVLVLRLGLTLFPERAPSVNWVPLLSTKELK